MLKNMWALFKLINNANGKTCKNVRCVWRIRDARRASAPIECVLTENATQFEQVLAKPTLMSWRDSAHSERTKHRDREPPGDDYWSSHPRTYQAPIFKASI